MTETHAAVTFFGLSLLLFVLAVARSIGRVLIAGRERTAPGTITGFWEISKHKRPTVSFALEGTSPITFNCRESNWHAQVGQTVTVYYDPRNPQAATTLSPRGAYIQSIAMAGAGVGMFLAAAVFGFLAMEKHERLDAASRFLGAVRSGDAAAVRAWVAPGAVLDEAFLEQQIRPSTGLDEPQELNAVGDQACIIGKLRPQGGPLALSLVRIDAEWKVRGAGPIDRRVCNLRKR